jgi:signal transduction histidine kinase
MWRRTGPLRRALAHPSALDRLAAVGISVWFVATVLSQPVRPVPVALACGVAMGIPLAWRRQMPLAVGLVVATAFFLQSAAGVDPQSEVATVAAMFFAASALGGVASVRMSLVALVAMFALGAAATSGAVFAGLVVFGGWIVGRVLRIRDQESQRLARVALDNEVRARTAVLEERARIARELHDVVAHTVGVMVVQAGAAAEVMDSTPDRSRAALERIQDAGQQALRELRGLLGVLRSEEEEPTGPAPGLASVPALVDTMRDAGLSVRLEGSPGPLALDACADLAAYRVIQEALTNAMKHGSGDRVDLTIGRKGDRLHLTVVGGHATAGRPGAGHGLLGMRERVVASGGEIEVGPGPNGRFAVHAWLPAGGVS